jgi:tetratricopeptide (TPR) repeat protein
MTPVMTDDEETSVATLSDLGALDSQDAMLLNDDHLDHLDHMGRIDPPRRHNPPPIMVPPRFTTTAKAEPVAPVAAMEPEEEGPRDNTARVLPRLLAMADTYRNTGSIRQAIELYFELIKYYSDSPQALKAEDRLLDVAQSYELAGELRQARGIYERLL